MRDTIKVLCLACKLELIVRRDESEEGINCPCCCREISTTQVLEAMHHARNSAFSKSVKAQVLQPAAKMAKELGPSRKSLSVRKLTNSVDGTKRMLIMKSEGKRISPA